MRHRDDSPKDTDKSLYSRPGTGWYNNHPYGCNCNRCQTAAQAATQNADQPAGRRRRRNRSTSSKRVREVRAADVLWVTMWVVLLGTFYCLLWGATIGYVLDLPGVRDRLQWAGDVWTWWWDFSSMLLDSGGARRRRGIGRLGLWLAMQIVVWMVVLTIYAAPFIWLFNSIKDSSGWRKAGYINPDGIIWVQPPSISPDGLLTLSVQVGELNSLTIPSASASTCNLTLTDSSGSLKYGSILPPAGDGWAWGSQPGYWVAQEYQYQYRVLTVRARVHTSLLQNSEMFMCLWTGGSTQRLLGSIPVSIPA